MNEPEKFPSDFVEISSRQSRDGLYGMPKSGTWNGVRFGHAALQQGYQVMIFLMSAGVEIEHITFE